MPGLTGPYLKVSRAKEHLDSLNSGINEFRESESYRYSAEENLQTSEYIITIVFDEPPLPLSLIVGDFICCLRSALDHLAWQLALLTTLPKFPSRKVEFPIIGKFGSRTEGIISDATKGIPEKAVARIRELQPYNRGSAYKSTHLWRLHTLWNIEKHRHLTIHSCILNIQFPGVKPPKQVHTKSFDNGCILALPLSSKPDTDLKPWATVDVSFGDVEEGIELNAADLIDMYQFVGEKVIPGFSSFFSQSPVIWKP